MKSIHALRTHFSARVFLAVVSLTFFSVPVFTPEMRQAIFGSLPKSIPITVSRIGGLAFVCLSKQFVSLALAFHTSFINQSSMEPLRSTQFQLGLTSKS
ncbi:MAG: hypothetical protein JST85_29870 [Acidobacteria bacterium]|nr:hypothetical protein [Acidobacteriota bacterium]